MILASCGHPIPPEWILEPLEDPIIEIHCGISLSVQKPRCMICIVEEGDNDLIPLPSISTIEPIS